MPMPPAERIKKNCKTDPVSDCWNWTGAVKPGKRPYGSLVVGSRKDGTRRTTRAHRYSYEVFCGPIGDLHVCHRCDNPRCVNPEHLFLGTAKDNADDRDAKGRNSPPPRYTGEQHPRAKLTDEQVAEIRRSSKSSLVLSAEFGVDDSHIRAIRRNEYRPKPPVQS